MFDVIKKIFIVYDQTKENGWRVSMSMVVAVISVISWAVVKFTPIDTGLTDAQINEIATNFMGVYGIVIGWLRLRTTAPVALHDVAKSDTGPADPERIPDYPLDSDD